MVVAGRVVDGEDAAVVEVATGTVVEVVVVVLGVVERVVPGGISNEPHEANARAAATRAAPLQVSVFATAGETPVGAKTIPVSLHLSPAPDIRIIGGEITRIVAPSTAMGIEGAGWRAVVLVEGESDRAALLALAGRRRIDLDGVGVVAMGGATNLAAHVRRFGPPGIGLTLAGLCDVAEEPLFRRHLAGAEVDVGTTRESFEAAGFFVCVSDLEDELIRALGEDAVIEVIESEGELGSLRRLQAQPAQRDRTVTQHLHRFIGVRSGRKARYGALLVEALDLDRVPRPLDAVLAHVAGHP